MQELHPIGVTEEFRSKLESVDPRFVKEGLQSAREKSWSVFNEIKKGLVVGMSEVEARDLARKVFLEHGVKKHWHQPVIRFNEGTLLTFHTPLRADGFLKESDIVFMDLGPVWFHAETEMEYEGDVGDTFVFGVNAEAEALSKHVKLLFHEGRDLWKKNACTGKEMYQLLEKRANELGYELVDEVVGHRVSDFPHHRYTKEQVPKLEFRPASHLWILELQIINKNFKMGAFFEDLLF